MKLPQAFYFTDEQRGADPLQLAEELSSSCGIIFRHYGDENRAKTASILSKICKTRQIPLIIAQTPELAHGTKSMGCHIAEYLIPQIPLMRKRFPELAFTTACHSERTLYLAARMGATASFLSPIFPTNSHLGRSGLGLMPAALIRKRSPLPLYALGGVTPRNWRQLSSVGFRGFGAISSLENKEFEVSDLISGR